MAADPHRCHIFGVQLTDIVHRQPLGRNHLPVAHVEVFLPAHQRIVRSPEADVDAAVVQKPGRRRELGVLLRDKLIPIAHQLCLAKPGAVRRRPEQLQVILPPAAILPIRQPEEFLRSLTQGDRRIRLLGRLPLPADVGQRGENQRIDVVGRVLSKGQVATPAHVIHHI